ncbi:hypothetical protein J437_LFUL006438 [Ladona fulva]|uniref:AN1-type domain-containing protein n=1 Tax=Ladona fulva TaxID=123851 RepID=A0A8K0K2T9_LADFU|nr:hypothetical protein J437_LFUL006438 [Ladona fulva]
MEFPHLGKNCSQGTCNKLDFLPVKCDACKNVFCHEHFTYQNHDCPSAYKKNFQVPVCPLCNSPIPSKRGELPDIAVGAHIDNDCQSDPAKSRRVGSANKCNVKGCKEKELVPILCRDCSLNFCLKHRHVQDHQCRGSSGNRSKAGEAAIARQGRQTSSPSSSSGLKSSRKPPPVTAIQGQMSEDEALSRALKASLAEIKVHSDPQRDLTVEEEDEMLARAIAESEREQHMSPARQSSSRDSAKDRCAVS